MIDPLGIGKIINDKFAQIGENVLGTVIDQIVDNSSAHLSSLNDFQSSSIMKLLRKVAGSKFLNKQPILEVEPNVYAIWDEQSRVYKSHRDSSILGVLTVSVERAIISPMGFNRNIRNFIVRENAEWVFELTLQGQMLVSMPVPTKDFILDIPVNSPALLSPIKNSSNTSSSFQDEKLDTNYSIGLEKRNFSGEREKEKSSGVGAREVFFNFRESFQVTDITSDLNLDLICRIPIHCRAIVDQEIEEVDEDLYFSKNSTSLIVKEFDDDSSLVSDSVNPSGPTISESATNICSNPLNNPNYSIGQRIKHEQGISSGSSFKQYKVIRVEKDKPNCKVIFNKEQEENIIKPEQSSQNLEWEVQYECIHFGKVTIPMSNIFNTKLSKLPILDYSLDGDSKTFNAIRENFISRLFLGSRTIENFQGDPFLSKSNTIEEWTVVNTRKYPSDDLLGGKISSFANEELSSHQYSRALDDSNNLPILRSRFKSRNKIQDASGFLEVENESGDQITYDYKEFKQLKKSPEKLDGEFEIESLNWYHLYPKTSEMVKYVRPVPGITEYGLSNPLKTLGFIQIGLHFETQCSSKIKFQDPDLTGSL
ncbi:apicomplexan specific membrane protein, 4+ transmembrane domain [Cryptosporidium felis]|nr:apicomplexan specific membrane protein, 4+ transmembrane domain [Cryptosporidium felis]